MPSVLETRLNLILEDVAAGSDDIYQQATGVATELEAARRRVTELERDLIVATDRLCGGLALGVRRHQPGLNVVLERGAGGGCCRIGYRSKHLTMRPDLATKAWMVDSRDQAFARHFTRRHGVTTVLTADLGPLAQAVADFFAHHYRSLGESIRGTGLILMDGRLVTYGALVESCHA